MNNSRLVIFSYGSNMLSTRMQASNRAPNAKLIGKAALRSHSLKWNKPSKDKSGKCNIEHTDLARDCVWGVLFEVNEVEKRNLDRAEGGYSLETVTVENDLGITPALAYVAIRTDDSLLPYDSYKRLVADGAREHGLPPAYIEMLEATISLPDPE